MHRVERKETVYSICKQYGITEEELLAANPEIKNKKLKKGKFLCIPYPKETATTSTTIQPQTNVDATLTDAQLFDKNKKKKRKSNGGRDNQSQQGAPRQQHSDGQNNHKRRDKNRNNGHQHKPRQNDNKADNSNNE
jgi:spore germination protein YaaH